MVVDDVAFPAFMIVSPWMCPETEFREIIGHFRERDFWLASGINF